ncbi:hypothetical protein B0H13DRAFT_2273786 [Mycena leptocephala]|nr:hypothetical protein B0H13DRAFT_2273786 [Mycena leptocephala]
MYAKTQTGRVSISALPAFPKLASPVQAVLVAQGIRIGGQPLPNAMPRLRAHIPELWRDRTRRVWSSSTYAPGPARHVAVRLCTHPFKNLELRFLHSHSSYRGNRENRQKSPVSSAWMYCK